MVSVLIFHSSDTISMARVDCNVLCSFIMAPSIQPKVDTFRPLFLESEDNLITSSRRQVVFQASW